MNNEELQKAIGRISSLIKEEEVEFIRFEFSDMYGISRCKVIPARYFEDKASNGLELPLCHLALTVDGCLLTETPYGDDIVGFGDATWFPAKDTYRVIPWCRKTASILLEPTFKGEMVKCFPRVIARQQLERLKNLGISLFAAHEHEFYVVDRESKKPLTQDSCLRSTLRTYADADLLYQLMTDLPKVGVEVEAGETEHGDGQMEITYKPAFGIRAADNAHIFKSSVKEIAQQRGYIASFMSKPYEDQMGSSAHFCHSLWDVDGKKSLLYDANGKTGLSKLGEHWLAGILKHARAITLLMAPTANCYKRHGQQSYVNTRPNWGIDNRTCMLRVKINGSRGTYFEARNCASASNPYLTLAAIVAAGIDGIERELPLTPPETGDTFKVKRIDDVSDGKAIPKNLNVAMEAFQVDDVIRKAFGDDFGKVFLALKSYEIKAMVSNDNSNKEESYTWDRNMFFKYI